MRIAIALVLAAACGKRAADPAPAPSAPPPPPIDAAGADAPALRAALAAARDAMTSWRLEHGDPGFDAAPPPPAIDAAVAALVAWDRPGATFAVPCRPVEQLDEFPVLNTVAAQALDEATGPDDPRVHAALAIGAALRRPEQDPIAIQIGLSIAADAAAWAERHEVAPPMFDDLAPEPDVLTRMVRADARCQVEIAARDLADPARRPIIAHHREELRLDPARDLVAEEMAAERAFCDETVALVLAAATPDDQEIVADQRSLLSVQHPTAAVVNWYACYVLGIHDANTSRRDYADRLARARQRARDRAGPSP